MEKLNLSSVKMCERIIGFYLKIFQTIQKIHLFLFAIAIVIIQYSFDFSIKTKTTIYLGLFLLSISLVIRYMH
jgi:hypothetical protein